ncbi:helix-turn-helix domain-containing protein [Enterovibrio sp. ZSDZ42]|uniref:Helix-turn-helix domain-containing protein n=1 Tax=Enterovibrio gelatinilyticus TaxID=2899819 RepID=A0ABT5QX14_9GAMM|nr:phage repressor protein CI [Enterovibrio sp. ZSDZ42]MDD1792549.1 helix-turn-helix domain-containing protein [Enterovibrio sp. ZSDZ42]
MSRLEAKIPPYEYLGGKDLVDRLKEIYNVGKDQQLADWTGVPAPTIGTWKQRDLTPYELVIRTCIAKGVNLEYLALGKGEPYSHGSENSLSEILPAKKITAGKAEDLPPVTLDKAFLPDGLSRENCVVFFTDDGSHLVDTNETDPSSGNYVIDIDGSHSINRLQRLPGGKVSIHFEGAPVVIDASELKVIGRVAMSWVKG